MKEKKDIAESFFLRIGTGKDRAIPRPMDKNVDRALRRLIEKAQSCGDIIINTGDGTGYYRPDFSAPEELAEYRHYINQKRSRIKAEYRTLANMEYAAASQIIKYSNEEVYNYDD